MKLKSEQNIIDLPSQSLVKQFSHRVLPVMGINESLNVGKSLDKIEL